MSKEAISNIREALGKDSSKVETLLVEIEGDYKEFQRDIDDKQETINTVNTESKTRKLKIREIESELEDSKEEIETLKKQDNSKELEDLKQENQVYKDAETEKVKTKAKGFIDKYDKLKDHTDWESCKVNFNLPNPIKDDKEGKLDWENMDDNDIAKNADKLTEYIGIGKLGEANPNSELKPGARKLGEADEENPYTKDGISLFND